MLTNLRAAPSLFLRPAEILQTYRPNILRSDLIAGLTVGVILMPQAIAFALVAGLPPQMGLYAAIVAAIAGGFWGSSNQLHTGPTNTASILVLSTLLPFFVPGSPEYLVAAGLLAVLAGLFRLVMGLAGLGMLVNFVSVSVIIGFTAGAGVLILVSELRHLLRLDVSASPNLFMTLQNLLLNLPETHYLSLALGLGTIVLIVLVQRLAPRVPGLLVGIVVATAIVALLGLNQQGVIIIGQLPRSLPPLARLPLFNLELIGQLSTGALAMAAIGLVEATAIARSLASQTGQRLDNNQEFVGQGLANIASGLFSGYPVSGSFNRSVVSYRAGAQTPLASVVSGLFVLVGILVLAPLAAYLPRAALAGILILAAYGMIDRKEMVRIWRGAHGDAAIMIVTLLGTLFFPLQFAVLAGILLSLAYYILKTSAPRVLPVVPDDNFRHLVHQPRKPACPQLGIIDILGALYFGAVGHIEKTIYQHQAKHPRQRFLLLRMHSVDHCDISGIHMLESIVRSYRERGGDVFMVRVRAPVFRLMKSTGFYDHLGADHFLPEDDAIEYLFYKVLDPAICIYESDVRVFKECQNLPRPDYPIEIRLQPTASPDGVVTISPQQLWQQLRGDTPPLVIDVREPREFKRSHIPRAQLMPLSKFLSEPPELPYDRQVVLVCESGRRSTRAAQMLSANGYDNIVVLQGGMVAWHAAGLLEAID
ncbi:MAG: SulP family inorganic anion transporter [Pseudomonadota bacterium]|nr:SulP family inorganic anion transporter [Pseudomonadota bacterium]